jgi:hypothetical protein
MARLNIHIGSNLRLSCRRNKADNGNINAKIDRPSVLQVLKKFTIIHKRFLTLEHMKGGFKVSKARVL